MYTKEELMLLNNKKMIVYKITNLVNGKIYIGQTTQTFNKRYRGAGVGIERVKGHYEMKGNVKNQHLYNAIIKYGVDSFKVEILEHCISEKNLNETELKYIKIYDSTDDEKGYNIETGGDNKRRSFKWRIEKLISEQSDLTFFTELVSNKRITKEELLELLNTRVVYIAKNGSSKKYYAYNNIRECCAKNKMSVEDGFCMVMRKRDGSRKNKTIYHHVPITKHEIWFRNDIDINIKDFEAYKTAKLGRKRVYIHKKSKKRKTKHYHTCPDCGKTILSTTRKCADCKRKTN